jgi:NAD(P)-dependent dehydrogenase (short-subunit alcohol dehydrogenase family)
VVTVRGLGDLTDRVAVVTGGASGLGLAMAERFAAEGMKLVLADIEAARLRDAAQALRDKGHAVEGVEVDVSRHEDLERLAEAAYEAFGAVHVLCNNAGVVKSAPTWSLTLDDWNWVLGVDLWGVIYGIRAFVPRMLAEGAPGHLVNTASVAGLLPMPNLAAYGAAKSGVVFLSESLQLDLDAAGARIGVSVLCPGYIPTRILESERNRPATLADAAPPPSTPRTTDGVQPQMDAADVARQVVEAIGEGRFWVLTHPRYREVIQERATRIGTETGPVAPPVW